MKRIIYYTDEKTDEFSEMSLARRRIDESYEYLKRSLDAPVRRFLLYRILMSPTACLYTKLFLGHRVEGREVLLPYKKQGYFLFGNHTHPIGDAFIPHAMDLSKGKYTVVNSENLSVPLIGRITPELGALPVPDTLGAMKSFNAAIERLIREGECIVIYPEGHIWPYYTGIRPFPDTSFRFAAKLLSPVFCFTNTYQKRPLCKKGRIVTYVDGPFFADASLPLCERTRELRDAVYRTMCERAKCSTVEYVKYIKKEDTI